MAVGTLMILIPGFLLARSIARGLRAVATAASGIAAGDLEQEVNVRSQDELGRMVDAFRDMSLASGISRAVTSSGGLAWPHLGQR